MLCKLLRAVISRFPGIRTGLEVFKGFFEVLHALNNPLLRRLARVIMRFPLLRPGVAVLAFGLEMKVDLGAVAPIILVQI